jgi:hypothetical protein
VTPPVEAEAGDQAVEESQGLMSASQLLQLQEDSQRLRSFRHPAPGVYKCEVSDALSY